MNKKEMIQALLNGKKVKTNECTLRNEYVEFDGEDFRYSNGGYANISMHRFVSIYEEPKELEKIEVVWFERIGTGNIVLPSRNREWR